jgi:hypothetical protein
MSRRCSNCRFYPFCDKCEMPTGKCEEWKGRDK